MKKKLRETLLLICLCMAFLSFPVYLQVQGAEVTQASAGSVDATYLKQSFADWKEEGMLEIKGGMHIGSSTIDRSAGGIILTGLGSDLTQGRLVINKTFDFSQNTVGRISLDGLASRNVSLSVAIYLDDEEKPAATLPLIRQKRAGKWNYEGEVTRDVLEQKIRGRHTVSLGFVTENKSNVSVLLRSLEFVEASLPVIYFDIDESIGTIDAMNNDSEHETECYGNMTVEIPEGYTCEYTHKTTVSAEKSTYVLDYLRGRGNSTWTEKKKPYKIKLDKKADLFGMGKNKHWVLLANRFDNSKLRNKITYWLGSSLGMPFTPQSVPVDVVMNNTYCGSYYLAEQVRVGKSRVEIDDLEDNDDVKKSTDPAIISGGYLLSMEPYGDELAKTFQTSQGNHFLLERPAFEDYNNETQYNYIADYVQHTEDAIYGEGFKDADGRSYSEWMDVDSAVDYYWMQEFSMNGDGFISTSTYLYKPRNDKLYWGPLWDFDYVAWGSYDYSEEPQTEGFVHRNSTWFDRLLDDKEFAQKVVDRWPALKAQLTELIRDGGMMDQYYDQLVISDRYDFEKWGAYDFEQGTPLTLKQEEQRLKDWILRRIQWVDENISSLIPEIYTVTYTVDGKVCEAQEVVSTKGITSLPDAPEKPGYVFAGWWYTDSDGMEWKLYAGDCIYQDITAEAVWIDADSEIKPKELYFLYSELTISLYDEYQIPYTVVPEDVTNNQVSWTTSDESIATVDETGCINPINTGRVTITGTCCNGIKQSVLVSVVDYEEAEMNNPDELVLNKKSMTLQEGQIAKLTPSMEPQPCLSGSVRWIVVDPDVVSISDAGVVTALQEGTTAIIALNTYYDMFASCRVTVKNPVKNPVKSPVKNPEAKVKKGAKYTVAGLRYKVTKTGAKGRAVTCIGRKKKSLKSVRIPDKVKIKGQYYKVTAIGAGAFRKTNIKSITLGNNIKKIGKAAFKGCKKLKTIKVKAKRYKAYKKLLKKSTGFNPKKMKLKKISSGKKKKRK